MKRTDQIFPRFLLPIAAAMFLLVSLTISGEIAPALFACSIALILVSVVVLPMMKRLDRLEARAEHGDD